MTNHHGHQPSPRRPRLRLRPLPCTLLLAACLSGIAHADNAAPRPRLSVPLTAQAPAITADPSDPAWARAAIIPALPVSLGDDGKGLSPLPTQVKLLWDQNNLYLRFLCAASEVYAPLHDHDSALYKGDCVEVFLDARGDGREWIELEVSPDNATFDQVTTLTAAPTSDMNLLLTGDVLQRDYWADLSWSLDGWRTAASVQKTNGRVTGWTVDMALPAQAVLRRLGMGQYGPMTMRANFLRYEQVPVVKAAGADPGVSRRLLAMDWSPVLYGCPHISPLAMGYLVLAATPAP